MATSFGASNLVLSTVSAPRTIRPITFWFKNPLTDEIRRSNAVVSVNDRFDGWSGSVDRSGSTKTWSSRCSSTCRRLRPHHRHICENLVSWTFGTRTFSCLQNLYRVQSFRGPCNRVRKSSFFGAKLRFRIQAEYIGSMYTLVDLGHAKKSRVSHQLKYSWPIGSRPIFSASPVLANPQKLDRDSGLNQKLGLKCENIVLVVPYMSSHKLFECLDTLSHARTDRALSLPLHGKIGVFLGLAISFFVPQFIWAHDTACIHVSLCSTCCLCLFSPHVSTAYG